MQRHNTDKNKALSHSLTACTDFFSVKANSPEAKQFTLNANCKIAHCKLETGKQIDSFNHEGVFDKQ